MNVYVNPKPPKLKKFERFMFNLFICLMLIALVLVAILLVGVVIYVLLQAPAWLAEGR